MQTNKFSVNPFRFIGALTFLLTLWFQAYYFKDSGLSLFDGTLGAIFFLLPFAGLYLFFYGHRLTWYNLTILIICLPFTLWFGVKFVVDVAQVGKVQVVTPNNQDGSQPSRPVTISMLQGAQNFYSEKNSLELTIHPQWSPVNNLSSVSLPPGFTSLDFAFRHASSTCLFAYGHLRDNFRNIIQRLQENEHSINLGDRLYMSVSWFTATSSLPIKIGFYDPTPSYFRSGSQAFVLSDSQQDLVNSDCSLEVDQMLSTAHQRIDPSQLSHQSVGLISFEQENEATHFYLQNPADDIVKKIYTADVYPDKLTVYDNQLYFINRGKLDTVNLLLGAPTWLPQVSGPINDFYFHGGKIYTLRGPLCLDYRATCNSSLIERDLTTGEERVLASNISARDILGVDNQENAVYLAHREGDAGCGWGSYYRYQLSGNTLESVGRFEVCEGEPKAEEIWAKMRSYIERFSDQNIRGGVIAVNRGSFQYAEIPNNTGNIRFILR